MSESEKAIIEAAQRVCNAMSEEDIHTLADHIEGNQTAKNEWASAMIDLGMAVQLHEALE